MPQSELLKRVVKVLDQLGVEYMLTGSLASSMQGEPRSTHDVDLVVQMGESAVQPLADSFAPPRYFLSAAAIQEAVLHKRMFNLLDVMEGDKVDFWMLTDEPFDQARFSRRLRHAVCDFEVFVSSPEDTILAKLRWAKLAGSERQMQDALSVYEVQFRSLDQSYLDRWAQSLQVASLLQRIRREAEPP